MRMKWCEVWWTLEVELQWLWLLKLDVGALTWVGVVLLGTQAAGLHSRALA